MKTVRKPKNLMEWIAVKANLYPAPLEVIGRIITSRALLLASKLGVFEAAKDSPQTIAQIAQRTKLHPQGLAGLTNILTSLGHLKYKDGSTVRAQDNTHAEQSCGDVGHRRFARTFQR